MHISIIFSFVHKEINSVDSLGIVFLAFLHFSVSWRKGKSGCVFYSYLLSVSCVFYKNFVLIYTPLTIYDFIFQNETSSSISLFLFIFLLTALFS